MPLYEYYCSHCHTQFDALRSMKDADAPIKCEYCESKRTARVLSVVFVNAGSDSASASASSGGGCGCGGTCSCGHSHN